MPAAFQYKPRFVDIRVRPPSEEEDARAEDVHALKPGERACDHPGCRLAATARAPKTCQISPADEKGVPSGRVGAPGW